MNYRHAYHAGNFADCAKHALLVAVMRALRRKPAPFFVLDTHAGAGAYSLDAAAARRTGEWRGGIGRLPPDGGGPLADYVSLVRRLGRYPGSPLLIQALLRDGDRMACCELHPEDAATLRTRFAGDPRVAAHRRDGYEALRGLLPPEQKRGLVFIDPPYERSDEFERVACGLRTAHARFATATLVAWYPVKHRAPVRAFHQAVVTSGLRDVVAAELLLREPDDPAWLNGCGLVVVQPPYRFDAEAEAILQALVAALGAGEAGQAAALTRLVAE